MLQDRSFFGGISISVKDSLQGTSVVNSLDVKLTISAVGISAYCTTRQAEVWSVRFALIEDIRRGNDGDSLRRTPSCLVIDYKAQSHGNLFQHREEGDERNSEEFFDERELGAAPISIYNNYRRMESFLYHPNRDFIDEVFQTLLPRWSFKQVSPGSSLQVSTSNSFHPATVSSSPKVASQSTNLGMGSNLHGFRVDEDRGGANFSEFASTSAVTNPSRYTAAVPDPYYSSADLYPQKGPLQDWAGSQLSMRHHAQSSAAIEEQLSAIQHRRKERQRHLISHLQEGGALSGLATGGLASPGTGYSISNQATSDVAGPTIEENYRFCPYCNKLGSRAHQSECQLRPVECSWCGQRMRFSEFPYHAAVCRPLELGSQQHGERPPAPTKIPTKVPDESKPPASHQLTVVASPPESPKQPAKKYGRLCRYCGLDRPKEHDAECREKKVSCKVCHSIILQKDKQHHKATCQLRNNPKKYDSNATAEHRERMVKFQQATGLQSSKLSVSSGGSSGRNEVL